MGIAFVRVTLAGIGRSDFLASRRYHLHRLWLVEVVIAVQMEQEQEQEQEREQEIHLQV